MKKLRKVEERVILARLFYQHNPKLTVKEGRGYIDNALKAIQAHYLSLMSEEEIGKIIARELPVNYDGTDPGNWHILFKVAKAISEAYKRKIRRE